MLYMPAAEPSVSVDRGAREEKIQAEADKQLKMSGVVLSDQEIIQAMEAGARGEVHPRLSEQGWQPGPVQLGPFPAGAAHRAGVFQAVDRRHGARAAGGPVEPEPALTGRNSCRYCPYSPVCGRELDGQNVKQDKTTSQEALAQMEEALQKGGKAHG